MLSRIRCICSILALNFCLTVSPAMAAGGPFGGYYGEVNLINDAISFYVVQKVVQDFGADVLMQCNDPTAEEPDFERVFSVRGEDMDGRTLPTIRINKNTGRGRASFTYRDSSFRIGTVSVTFKLKRRGTSKVRFEIQTTPDGGSNETCSALVNFNSVAHNGNLLPSE